MQHFALLLLATLIAVGPAHADDWPQFRGATGQGHSSERNLPVEWSESKNVSWKTPIEGSGWSSPVVAGGRVWLTTAVPQSADRSGGPVSLRVVAFDVATGKSLVNVEVFRAEASASVHPKNSRASPTPILDGGYVYVHFGADGTAALTTAGDVVWRTRFRYDSQHGSGGSPVLHAGLLIINCDGNAADAFVVAIDARTGKERWRTQRRQPADQAYTTPLVIRVGDRDQVVSVGAYRAGAYDPATGRELWRVAYDDGFSNVPRPVFGHGLVYIATGFQQPTLIAVRADGTGDVTRSHIAWTLRRGAPFTPSPILVGAELYVVNDSGILTCVDAQSGAIRYQQRLGGNFSASPIFADGRLYFLSEEGVATIVAPGQEFRVLAQNRIDGSTLASIAVSDGSFFVRSDTHLYRISGPRP